MELMPSYGLRLVRFSAFEVDLRAGELRRNGVKVKIQNQPFQILAMLLERPGEIITRDEMQARLWPAETFVDFDHGLNSAIRRLRDALGDSAESSHLCGDPGTSRLSLYLPGRKTSSRTTEPGRRARSLGIGRGGSDFGARSWPGSSVRSGQGRGGYVTDGASGFLLVDCFFLRRSEDTCCNTD